VITGFPVRHGWADALHVDVFHSSDSRTGRSLGPGELAVIREAISRALRPQRHSIRVLVEAGRVSSQEPFGLES
jgi:hypothetical protein